ncbi:MAG: hypothetical protein II347_06175, partial [Lachnospiraceae bacterium]|nr:hypothetical protein [Lachnospiraceae bacterium]
GRGSSGPSRISTSTSFKNYEVGKIYCHGCSHSGTFDTLKIDTFMLNADGSYTYAVYIPK